MEEMGGYDRAVPAMTGWRRRLTTLRLPYRARTRVCRSRARQDFALSHIRRCCTSLATEDSLCESMRLHGLHEQATSRPLSHDELVQLQRVAAQTGVSADLGR